MRVLGLGLLASAALTLTPSLQGQTPNAEWQSVSVCQILKDPKLLSGKKIQFRGRVSSQFEDFAVHDEACNYPDWPGIWLMFGGDVDCPTPSTWNDVYRPKGKNVKFDGVEYPLVKDESFRVFLKAVTRWKTKRPPRQISATLEGTFIAGDVDSGTHRLLPGYGHLGCCHLFIIHQVKQVEVQE